MYQKSDLTAAGDYIEINVSKKRNGAVRICTGPAAVCPAGAVFALQTETVRGTFKTEYIYVTSGAPAFAASVTGPDQIAWVDVPACERVRLVRTDATGTAATASFEYREG